jgi:hypothetical protein
VFTGMGLHGAETLGLWQSGDEEEFVLMGDNFESELDEVS